MEIHVRDTRQKRKSMLKIKPKTRGFTHLLARSRRSDSRSAGAIESDANYREVSANAVADREMV